MKNNLLITCSAMGLALGIGSAFAAEPVEKTTIMPQNVQAMAATELEAVRGTWWPVNPNAAFRVTVVHDGLPGGPAGLAKKGGKPPGQQ